MGLRMIRAAVSALVVAIALLAASAATAGAQTSASTPSDVGPASLPSGTGDPNLGVANQPRRTFDFDNGWRFKLVNTENTSDPSGAYGNSDDPKAVAPNFPDSGWERVTGR
jgi:hypothetical protein